MRNAENYYVSFFGNPNVDSLWAWSFEGHHLSLKFTTTSQGTSVVPRFMGASPATIPNGPRKGERTLQNEQDYGIQLIQSMTAEQQKKAVFKDQPYLDVVTKNASEVGPLYSVGIKTSELDQAQKDILDKLITEYLATLPNHLADQRFTKIRNEEYDIIRFGWAGSTVANKGHYYRIQGKTFLVEFDNVQNSANHIHTVWREFDGDFGRDLIREHYLKSEHHQNH